jgi:hypothetical protein
MSTLAPSCGLPPRLSRSKGWAWFLTGIAIAAVMQWHQLYSSGQGLAMTLRVGDTSPARSVIEAELGDVPVTRGAGHDGQYYYLIARHPVPDPESALLFDDPGYRYRRILYPLLAGGFGRLGPRATLAGLSIWAALGMGAAAAAASQLADRVGAPWWTVLGVIANPGLWLSTQLATPDTLALALALMGAVLCINTRWWAGVALLAVAGLTKEYYLLTAASLLGWNLVSGRRRFASRPLWAAFPVLMWGTFISVRLGGSAGFSPRPNIDLPLRGLVQGVAHWPLTSATDRFHAALILLGLFVLTTVLLMARDRLLSSMALPWVALAALSSFLVWSNGNNASRVLAPVWVWAALGLGRHVADREASLRRMASKGSRAAVDRATL